MPGQAALELLRRAFLPALCLVIGAYFVNHAISGRSGLLALDEIRGQKVLLLAERRAIEAERAALEQKIALLDPAGADPDLADELVRRELGVIHPQEIIVPLPPEPAAGG